MEGTGEPRTASPGAVRLKGQPISRNPSNSPGARTAGLFPFYLRVKLFNPVCEFARGAERAIRRISSFEQMFVETAHTCSELRSHLCSISKMFLGLLGNTTRPFALIHGDYPPEQDFFILVLKF